MEEKNIPYIVFESEMTRQERSIKRLIITLVVTILLLFGSNIAWLYAWCQYDYSSSETSVELSADGSSNANYIGENGEIINGGTR